MGCCGGAANWKREEVPDHKFDFIDVRDYYSNTFMTRLRYGLLFLFVFKSFAVYVADIYTAITLLAFHHFNGSIYTRVEADPDNNVKVPFVYGKWIFTGCIIFSFCLLAYEGNKTRRIIRSRDISYAYTNVMANNWYSIRSYDHFCFFCQINNSKKKKDEFAFFIFFTFKGWKRLLVADGPRQVVNALVLYAVAKSTGFSTDATKYYEGNYFTAVMLLTMIFTVVVFAGSAVLLAIACLMYLPLVCYIKGNLKEYCCHKIDKRITELVQKKKKQRLGKYAAIARAEAAGDFSHLMNKKGIIVGQKIMQPTLPDLDIDALEREGKRSESRANVNRLGSEKNLYRIGEGDDFSSSANLLANQGYAGPASAYGHALPGTNLSYSSSTMHLGGPALPVDTTDTYGPAFNASGRQTPSGPNVNDVLAQMGPIGTSPGLFAQRQVGRPSVSPLPYDPTYGGSRSLMNSADGRNSPAFASQRNLAGPSPLGAGEPRSIHRRSQIEANAYEMEQYNMSRSGSAFDNRQVTPFEAPEGTAIDLSAYAPYEGHADGFYGQEAPTRTSSGERLHEEARQHYGNETPLQKSESRHMSRHQSFAFGDVYDAYLADGAGDDEDERYYRQSQSDAQHQAPRRAAASPYQLYSRPQSRIQLQDANRNSQGAFDNHVAVGYALSPPEEAIVAGTDMRWGTPEAGRSSDTDGMRRPLRQPLENGVYYQNSQQNGNIYEAPIKDEGPQYGPAARQPVNDAYAANKAGKTPALTRDNSTATGGAASRYQRSHYNSGMSWATSSAANGTPFGYDTNHSSYGRF